MDLLENFEDFISLVLACGGTTAAEQISGWTEEQFLDFIEKDGAEFPDFIEKRKAVLDKIQNELGIKPMETPF